MSDATIIGVSASIASFMISQVQFLSFADIIKIAKLTDYDKFLEQNKKSNDFFLSEIKSKKSRELVLYWGGPEQIVPGGSNTYFWFASRGYRIVTENVHSSDFINSMSILTQTKLRKLGIPNNVNVIFPMPTLLFTQEFEPAFLRISRNKGKRSLNLINFKDDFSSNNAFILEKI